MTWKKIIFTSYHSHITVFFFEVLLLSVRWKQENLQNRIGQGRGKQGCALISRLMFNPN